MIIPAGLNGLPYSPPNRQMPTPVTETLNPVLPSLRYFVVTSVGVGIEELPMIL